MKKLLPLFCLTLCSCAALYHVQVADVENMDRGRVIDVKVSETAFDLKGVAQTGASIARHESYRRGNTGTGDKLAGLEVILALSNFGPRTGMPVFTDRYSDYVLDELISKCPTGKITGITSVREARQYPYISGEIVNIRAVCIEGRKKS